LSPCVTPDRKSEICHNWPISCIANSLLCGDLSYAFLRSSPTRRLDAGEEQLARSFGRCCLGRVLRARLASAARPRSLGRSHVIPYLAGFVAGWAALGRASWRVPAGIDLDDHTDSPDAQLTRCRS